MRGEEGGGGNRDGGLFQVQVQVHLFTLIQL